MSAYRVIGKIGCPSAYTINPKSIHCIWIWSTIVYCRDFSNNSSLMAFMDWVEVHGRAGIHQYMRTTRLTVFAPMLSNWVAQSSASPSFSFPLEKENYIFT